MTVAKLRGRPLPYLRAWRVSKYLAQHELAAMTGVARETITRAERGAGVSYPNIRKIAGALGITPDELTFTYPPDSPDSPDSPSQGIPRV